MSSTIEATCPLCHAAALYGDELIGRYTLCTHCRGRFYIEVPTLGAITPQKSIPGERLQIPSAKPESTLDDLLWDTQQGSRHVLLSLRRQESQAKLLLWLTGATAVLVALNSAGTALLLMR